VGLTLDVASHYWADRRTTLRRLAHHCGKSEFCSLGTPDHPAAPATSDGEYAPTLGTDAYALDLLCTKRRFANRIGSNCQILWISAENLKPAVAIHRGLRSPGR
jgi:hypothetical protein